MLDADAFQAFKESGDVFSGDVAARVREFVYAAGNVLEPGEAFRRFRGRDPQIEAMLVKKCLV